MNKFTVVTGVCEVCASEHIAQETKKLIDHPNDQRKTAEIHRAIHEAQEDTKCVVQYPCRDQMYDNVVYHNLCERHLYIMIDSIREHEEEACEA